MTRPSICPHPGCPHIAPCDTPGHQRTPWAGSTRHGRLPANWARLRQRILRRDPTCRECHAAPSAEVDHIINNDNHHPTNLQGLCQPCHQTKTLREAAHGRRQQQ